MSTNSDISSLAHRISFAVFRVSRLARHKKLRSELEAAAVELVRDLSEESAGSLGRLVDLAEAIEEMNEINADVLRRELNNLKDMIFLENSRFSKKEDSLNIADIFNPNSDTDDNYDDEENEYIAESSGNTASIKERQTEVIEFIRQLPNGCRMRDLIEKFPEVSERTLRNDIQFLIETGLIERLGGRSGPNSYFIAIDTSKYSEEPTEASGDPKGGSIGEMILLPEATRKV